MVPEPRFDSPQPRVTILEMHSVNGGGKVDHMGGSICRRSAKSNRLVCQEVATVGFQALPVFAMLLSTVSSFRIQAVRASFLGFPAARRRW